MYNAAVRYSPIVAIFAAGLVLLLAGCASSRPAERFSMKPEILQSFRQIQSEFRIETARCLLGQFEDGHVNVTGVYPPMVLHASPDRVQFKGCPDGTVGFYHNHPEQSWNTCRLSYQDRQTGDKHADFHVTLISCTPDLFLYRFRNQDETKTLQVIRREDR